MTEKPPGTSKAGPTHPRQDGPDSNPTTAPWPSSQPRPSHTAETTEAANKRIRALAITLGVVFITVVLPLTFFIGALLMLGISFSNAPNGNYRLFAMAVFTLVPIGYVWLTMRWIGRLKAEVAARPTEVEIMSGWGVLWGTLLAVFLVALALVVTCFGLLGLVA